MSTKVLTISHSIIRELAGIYALIYYAQKYMHNVLHSVIIKRGRAKVGKLWIFGKRTEDFECLY
jgi:hypothetical protein